MKRPLLLSDVKPMLLGHWGTTPGQNFIYVHLNRVIREHDLDMIYVCGPAHGGPAVVANTYLEGSYSEIYPHIGQDEAGLQQLFLQFSFPGGIPSHASPECPGSIHEGGELGYSLSHSFGACELAAFGALAEIDHDLVETDYGSYEGRFAADIRAQHSGWRLFRDGCPDGKTARQVCGRADRVLRRLRQRSGNIAVFSHGQFSRALAARWLGLPMIEAQHFVLDTASISILGLAPGQPDVAVIALWNSPPGITPGSSGDDAISTAETEKKSAIQRWENEGGDVVHAHRRRALASP